MSWRNCGICRPARCDVARALVKLDEATYGACDAWGKPIGEGRLEALPWATPCVVDAALR